MLLSQIVNELGCERLLPLEGIDETVVAGCFAADLMSEVLAFCGHAALLVTGLATVQAIHTADVADLHAILFVNGKRPDAAVLALARARGLPLLTTRLTMFEACGRLHRFGLRPSLKS